MAKEVNRYEKIVVEIFNRHYTEGATEFPFAKQEITEISHQLNIAPPKNTPDVPYAYRFRWEFPDSIKKTAKDKYEWVILTGRRGYYSFKQIKYGRIIPNPQLFPIKIPDATPEIITKWAFTDEQALLAKVRYNRLVDVFLGITTYSLQNHLRTSIKKKGQVEIDELYVGIDRNGKQYIIPVQAKGGNDKLAAVQTLQDLELCAEKFPKLHCKAISVQFMDDRIAMFDLIPFEDTTKIFTEKHYQLVPASQITDEDLNTYSQIVA